MPGLNMHVVPCRTTCHLYYPITYQERRWEFLSIIQQTLTQCLPVVGMDPALGIHVVWQGCMTLTTKSDFDLEHFLTRGFLSWSYFSNSLLLGSCYNLYRQTRNRFLSYTSRLLPTLHLFKIRINGIFYLCSYLVFFLIVQPALLVFFTLPFKFVI